MTNNVIAESSIDITDVTNLDTIVNDIMEESLNNASNEQQTISDNNSQEDNSSELALEKIKNSLSELFIDESVLRFSGAEWFEKISSLNVVLAGLGGIGSWLALLLSRLNINKLILIDSDKVEELNLAGQFFSRRQIGWDKVDCVIESIINYTNFRNYIGQRRKFNAYDSGPIMMCGFDNMRARLDYFNLWLHYIENLPSSDKRKECLFIDGRVSAEELQVFCITGDDEYNKKRYMNEFMFPDSEAEEEVCSYKQTTFMTNMIASIMSNLFVNFAANLCNPIVERDLPFFTYYDAKLMYFKTEK